MSRVSLIEQLYTPKKKSALEFNYDALWAPPIRFFLSQQDINELYKIATSLKYNDNIEKKYELIDAVMRPRGFKRGNCGTNRVVYNFLEDTSFCMKIALDRVGINDSPREYKNQEFFKPFCCKIFEVDPTGVIACVERVNPISSLEEFTSIADDVFNMMVTKIIGKYVVDDLGTEKFMNYGIRYNSNGIAFGPVVLDYPYAYELDGAKLHCTKPIQIGNREFACGGEIDYDAGLNNLVCCKCGKHYSARELAKDDSNVLKFYSDDSQCRIRARIVRADGTIIKDSGRSSKLYMTKEEYEEGTRLFEVENFEPRRVEKTIKKKYTPIKKLREQYYTELQTKAYEEMKKRNAEPFNPVIEPEFGPRPAKRASNKIRMQISNDILNAKDIEDKEFRSIECDDISRVRPARRAEDLGLNNKDVVNELKTEVVENIDNTSILESNMITVEFESKPTDNPMIEERSREFTSNLEKAINDNEVMDTIAEIRDYIVEQEAKNKLEETEDIVEESDDLNTAIIDALHEAANEKTYFGYPEDEEDVIVKIANAYVNRNDTMYAPEVFDDIDSENTENVLTSFSEAMEAAVFPEITNKNIVIGTDLSTETDYSNYVPPEDDEPELDEDGYVVDHYDDLYKMNRKNKKRNKKQQKPKTKKYIDDDMSDY